MAIMWVLRWMEECGEEKAVVYSYLLSALMALGGREGGRARSDMVGEILMMVFKLKRQGCGVGFLWAPAHVGVEGKRTVDKAARASLGGDMVEVGVPFGRMECRNIINERLIQQWQQEWNEDARGRKLYDIHPIIKPGIIVSLSWIDEIKWTRLRLGHCGLASELVLVGKHRDGKCEHCGVPESVKHVLLFCPRYVGERRMLFTGLPKLGIETFSLRTLLGDGLNPKERALEIIHFLKSTGLHRRI